MSKSRPTRKPVIAKRNIAPTKLSAHDLLREIRILIDVFLKQVPEGPPRKCHCDTCKHIVFGYTGSDCEQTIDGKRCTGKLMPAM
jgi:hypothetical protein